MEFNQYIKGKAKKNRQGRKSKKRVKMVRIVSLKEKMSEKYLIYRFV
jgi:hypothetical protein